MTACAWRSSAAGLLALATGAVWPALAGDPAPTREAKATIVVFNTKAPESRSLAGYYALSRRIPPEQVIGLDCPVEEEITRAQFTTTIEEPLRKIFSERGWWTLRENEQGKTAVVDGRIRYVALIRGMPLKIKTTIQPPAPDKPAPPRPNGGDPVRGVDEASVDSEIACLGAFDNERFGIIVNPYFRRFAPVIDSAVTGGLLLVARLDAPSADTVRRMIDDSLRAEKEGLYGWAYIDRRSVPESGYREGDEWLQTAAGECWNSGIPVILDNVPDILPTGFPVTDAALYYGWYAWTVGGAMAGPDLQFSPGAVAVHIQSFSAATLRDANANWAGPLVARGAAATIGNVYEPYLDLTVHLDIFNERLLQGFTLAESAYMGLKVLSWMNVVVGDPLYRPFDAARRAGWAEGAPASAAPWITLGDTLRKAGRSGLTQTVYLSRLARESGSGLDYEALGMLQSFYGEPRDALASLEAASAAYRQPAESFRTVIERVRILQSIGDKAAALKLIDRTAQRPQTPERAKLLTDLRNEIEPPPPTPSASPRKP